MTDLAPTPPNYTPLSDEQLAALNDTQKDIFVQLDSSDRQFFAKSFSPISLGKALERKWQIIQSRAALDEHDRRIRRQFAALDTGAPAAPPSPQLTPGDLAAGAAGVAGLVGIGVLARKVAPEGSAQWRGVTPRDLVEPLVRAFARQPRTDIRFDPPDSAGAIHGQVLLRTSGGLLPGLNIILTPLEEALEVQVSKISSQGMLQTVKESGVRLFDLVRDALRLGRSGDPADLVDLAGQVISHGAEIAQAVDDLDLEDKAWAAIQLAAAPLQTVYDEKALIANNARLRLEMTWDDYRACPRCRVEFGAGDAECRVCGTARPPLPAQPDPRTS